MSQSASQPSEFHHARMANRTVKKNLIPRLKSPNESYSRNMAGGDGCILCARVTFCAPFANATHVTFTAGQPYRVFSPYSRGVSNIRALTAPIAPSIFKGAGIMELLFQCANIYFRGYRSRYNFWDDMHVMFGAPGADSRILPAEGDDYFKERRQQPCSLFSPFPFVRELAPQRKRADRVIDCYARERRAARAQTVMWWKNVKDASSIYLLSITSASAWIRRCNVKDARRCNSVTQAFLN